MSLYAPPGMFAWDFWIVRAPDGYHMFHLQSPRRFPAGLRHFHASVGHAVSSDLTAWEYRGTVLSPGRAGEWDDRSIWTGSILEHGGRYWFLYTALQNRGGMVQRIGLAVSDDLQHFERHPGNPVLQADARWYATDRGYPHVVDWRDPHLVKIGGKICALITATTPPPSGSGIAGEIATRAADALALTPLGLAARRFAPASMAGRGCVALAVSDDFVNWKIHPPIFAPGRYSHLECPQLFEKDGLTYLIFSTMAGWVHPDWARKTGAVQTGVHAYVAPRPEGPFEPVNGNGVVLGNASRLYVARVVEPEERDGKWRALAWRIRAPGSLRFDGRITRPFDLEIDGPVMRAGRIPED